MYFACLIKNLLFRSQFRLNVEQNARIVLVQISCSHWQHSLYTSNNLMMSRNVLLLPLSFHALNHHTHAHSHFLHLLSRLSFRQHKKIKDTKKWLTKDKRRNDLCPTRFCGLSNCLHHHHHHRMIIIIFSLSKICSPFRSYVRSVFEYLYPRLCLRLFLSIISGDR